MTKRTVRLHLLVREADAGVVSQAIRERLEDRLVGLVPQETSPGLWAASGQWTPEEAAALVDACEGLPVRVVRGALLGVVEGGAVVVDRGQIKPGGDPTAVRLTFAAAVEEWEQAAPARGGKEEP
jgi:hypothetical protein